MRLMPIFFLLVVAPAAWAQQSRPANAPEQGPPSLSRSSFSARELHNERVLTDFFVGDFADIPSSFDREKVFFMALFRQYLEAYGRQCDAFLPANKVELTRTVCAREQYSVNRFGQRVGMSSCVEYRTEGIGVYADPTLNAAISKLGNDQQGSLLKDSVLKMGDQNAVNDLQQLPDDMNALLRRNACASPGLKRFQENLVLFSMGKPPIPLSGVAPAATSPLAPFKDQNYMRLLEDLIAEQGKTWMLNRFVRGSTSDVVVSRDAAGRPSKIVAKYLFNPVPGRPDRSQGSVAVDFSDGAPSRSLLEWGLPTVGAGNRPAGWRARGESRESAPAQSTESACS